MFGTFRNKAAPQAAPHGRVSIEKQVAQLEVTALRLVVEFMMKLTPPEQRAEMIKQLKAAVVAAKDLDYGQGHAASDRHYLHWRSGAWARCRPPTPRPPAPCRRSNSRSWSHPSGSSVPSKIIHNP
jgi:hypothetical protein